MSANTRMKILHIDIETAPHKVYAWGLWDQRIALNQIVEPGYTLCYAAQWHGSREIIFDSVHATSARKMLRGVHALLDEADAVCHYNGTSFDIPVLRGEFMAQKFKPYSPFAQIDLIKVARSTRMASRKLDYLAQTLGLGHKLEHKGMDLWRGCMDGDEAAWRTMERYNRQDVRLLAKLYKELLPWIKGHPTVGLYSGQHDGCTHCGSTRLQARGYARTRAGAYPRFQCLDCGAWNRGNRSEVSHKDKLLEVA